MKNQASRLYYIDWLRVLMISVVVSHHAGQAYGPTGGQWPVMNETKSALLGPFFTVNAGFGMALFFFISGVLVPHSFMRKIFRKFIYERALRLGIPIIVFGLAISPFLSYYFSYKGLEDFISYYIKIYIGQWKLEYGHLWFVFHLLIYNIVFAFLAYLKPALATENKNSILNHKTLILFSFTIGMITSLVRIFFQHDDWIKFLWLIPMEPTHLPQYVLLFAAGVVVGKNLWYEKIPYSFFKTWLIVGLSLALIQYLLDYLHSYSGILVISQKLAGVLFPFWESTLAVSLCFGLFGYAREHWNKQHQLLPKLSDATYMVYLIHVFVVVGFNILFADVSLPPFVKFLLVTVLSIFFSFLIAVGFRQSAYVAKRF